MSIGKRLLDLARASLTDFRTAFDRDEDRELLDAQREAARDAEAERAREDGEAGDDATIDAAPLDVAPLERAVAPATARTSAVPVGNGMPMGAMPTGGRAIDPF